MAESLLQSERLTSNLIESLLLVTVLRVVVVVVVEMTRMNRVRLLYDEEASTKRAEHVLRSIAVASICRAEERRNTVVRRDTIRPSACPPAAASIELSYKQVTCFAKFHSSDALGS